MTAKFVMRGGQKILSALAAELQNKGYDVTVATSQLQEAQQVAVSWWNKLKIENIPLEFSSSDQDKKVIDQIVAYAAFLKNAVHQYDIVILDSWNVFHAYVRSGTRAEHVYHLVQSEAAFVPESDEKLWKAMCFDLLSQIPCKRIAVSKYMQNILQGFSPHSEVFYMPLAIEKEFFQFKSKKKETYYFTWLITSSTFIPKEKGLQRIMNVMEILCTRGIYVKAYILSADSSYASPKAVMCPIEMYTGKNLKEMLSHFHKVDCAIFTSTKEAFGLSNAEVMASGLPIIALDAGGNREFMDEYPYFFSQDISDEELADAVSRLTTDAVERRKMSQIVREKVKGYTKERMVEAFIKIISS